jgi:hypothetical protein
MQKTDDDETVAAAAVVVVVVVAQSEGHCWQKTDRTMMI